MNVKRFVGKNAREAMAQARAAFGDLAVVLSNRPVPGGVEILAMPSAEAAALPAPAAAPVRSVRRAEATPADAAAPMSTVSFQEFVRERQRQDLLAGAAQPAALPPALSFEASEPPPAVPRVAPVEPGRFAAEALSQEMQSLRPQPAAVRAFEEAAQIGPDPAALMAELRAMRSMISSQLAGLSWFDSVRRSPTQTHLLRLMLGNGFSTAIARQLVQRAPQDGSEAQAEKWLLDVLSHNLRCTGEEDSLLAQGGAFALVGPTGVGKTTTCAKIAAHFAARHGAASVGLITVDTYRMAASDQLRAFGRLLNIPVHTARDGASLADLLNLFAGKKLVLVDTVGVGQRDRRLSELFAALPAGRLQRMVVLNAAAQAETLDEVAVAYGAGNGTRCVISKLDEAVKTGAAVDVAIRHKLRVEGFANGQRVPEDWHAADARVLVQKALMKPASSAWAADDAELGLLVTTPSDGRSGPGARHA